MAKIRKVDVASQMGAVRYSGRKPSQPNRPSVRYTPRGVVPEVDVSRQRFIVPLAYVLREAAPKLADSYMATQLCKVSDVPTLYCAVATAKELGQCARDRPNQWGSASWFHPGEVCLAI